MGKLGGDDLDDARLIRSDTYLLEEFESLPSIDLRLRWPTCCPHGTGAVSRVASPGIMLGTVENIMASECIWCRDCIMCRRSAVVELTLLELSMELCRFRRPRGITFKGQELEHLRPSSAISVEPFDVLDVLDGRMPNRLSEPPVHSAEVLFPSLVAWSTGVLPSTGMLSSGRNMKLG
jgi:hypothetical protein